MTERSYWDPEVQRERATKEVTRNVHGAFGHKTPPFASKDEALAHLTNNHKNDPGTIGGQTLEHLNARHQQIHTQPQQIQGAQFEVGQTSDTGYLQPNPEGAGGVLI